MAKQMGVNYVSIPTSGGTYETFSGHKQKVEDAGFKTANIGNSNVHNKPEVTLNLPAKGWWIDKTFEPPLAHGRKFTKDKLWENYTYFIKQVVPTAEEAGVRIGIHPDDLPVPELGGVPHCIFGHSMGMSDRSPVPFRALLKPTSMMATPT